MGTYLVRDNLENVHEAVRKQLERQNFKACESSNSSSSRILLARKRSEHPGQNIEARIRLIPYEDTTLVDTKLQMCLLGRIKLLVPLVSLITIVFFLVLYLGEFAQAVAMLVVYIVTLSTDLEPNIPSLGQPGYLDSLDGDDTIGSE